MKLVSFFAAVIGCCLVLGCTTSPKQSSPINIGVQLHSVRNDLQADFKGTLSKLSKLGIDGVEFAGNYGPYAKDPQGLKKLLDSLNLKVSGVHAPITLLQSPDADEQLKFFKAIGASTVIIPNDKRINDSTKIDELIAELKLANSRVNRFGMQLGYHNHAMEFEPFNGQTFWDYLAKNTPENFVLQLDVSWVMFANVNPNSFIKKYPNRTFTTHFKSKRSYKGAPSAVSKDTKAIIGQDDTNWQELYQSVQKFGGTSWIIVEQEEYPEPLSAFDALAQSVKGLKSKIH